MFSRCIKLNLNSQSLVSLCQLLVLISRDHGHFFFQIIQPAKSWYNQSCGLLIFLKSGQTADSTQSCGSDYSLPLFSDFLEWLSLFLSLVNSWTIVIPFITKPTKNVQKLNFIKTNKNTELLWHLTMIYIYNDKFQISVNCILIQAPTYILEGLSITNWQSFATHASHSLSNVPTSHHG